MSEVCFSQSCRAVDQQWIEGRASRFVGYCESGRTGQSIALAFNELTEIVIRVQVGVDVQLAQSRDYEWILDGSVVDASRQRDSRVLSGLSIRHRHLHSVRTRLTVSACPSIFHDDAVFQSRIGPQFFVNGLAQQLDVMLLKPFVKELGGHLDGQDLVLNFERLDGRKPRFERLAADVVFDYLEAVIPNGQVVLAHDKWARGQVAKRVIGSGRDFALKSRSNPHARF